MLIALCLLSAPALAQTDPGMGLDLTQEEEAPETPKEEPKEQPTPAPAAPAEEAPAAEAITNSVDAEREITQDDRVKSVQRKVY